MQRLHSGLWRSRVQHSAVVDLCTVPETKELFRQMDGLRAELLLSSTERNQLKCVRHLARMLRNVSLWRVFMHIPCSQVCHIIRFIHFKIHLC